ncbi:hypothetical protein [Pseudomonas sp. AM8]|uniref:hypothetical protein n=1 Tax=Pseudomonas sp. AM8 TaxID=2983368 RepID=UPI002E820323|nr:hypothetical protein [Pseudomonas sp. AM8]
MDFPKSVPSVGLVDGKFIDEDAVAGTPGSLIPSAWGNAVTQEILNVIQEAGLDPDEDDNTQLNAAIDQKIAGSSVSFASQPEAEDGTSITKAMSPLRVFQAIAKVVTQATETAFGWLKIATQAQVTTGTNDSVAVTPKKLATRLLDKADLNSPVFTGEPATNSTPPLHNNSARLANTNFVYQELLSLSLSVVGSARNLKMSVAAASANATLTADEIIVATSLGGAQVKLSSFNKSINLATVGAGGMDTGTAPVSGFVAIYAIYNPTTQVSALLAVNATSAAAPSVYGGASMPAGYTASALVSVWGTNASGQLRVGYQSDRNINFVAVSVLTSTASASTFTSVNISSAAPLNAVSVVGTVGLNSNSGALNALIASDATTGGVGLQQTTASAVTNLSANYNLIIATAQRIYYTFSATGSSASINIFVSGYTI